MWPSAWRPTASADDRGCSVGVDVDLVGFVADVQHVSDRPVVVVLRERDRVGIVQDLLDLLARPVAVRTV